MFLSTFIQGEGVAYRGRVLVELDTKLNANCTTVKDTISETDVVNVQVRNNEDLTVRSLTFSPGHCVFNNCCII